LTSDVPAVPVALTAAQSRAMRQAVVKKHHVAVILLHWFNALVWLCELATGLAIVSSPGFRVAPEWATSIVESAAGGRAALLRLHVAVGLAWIGVFLAYGIFGFHTYLRGEVLRRELAIDRDDVRWLVLRVRGILRRSHETLPPQGAYNAGQKLFAFAVYAMVPLVMLSGLAMAFRLGGPRVLGWALALHFSAVGAVVAGLVVHVYMGAVFPEEKPAFFSMLTGNVSELFAYRHHFKWWREAKLAQLEWEARQGAEAGGVDRSRDQAGPAAPEDAGQGGAARVE
jgi:formate dehydrogenase subunit gamma